MDGDAPGEFGRLYEIYKQLGSREPSTVEEAQAVIEYIRAEKGHLDDGALRELDTVSPRTRERLLRIVQLKQESEAAYTTSISEQLYSSKYRFLYELVQNADDSSYDSAKHRGASPFLRFNITPDAFIIETNEDGFSRANVEAICATGKSSKKASRTDDHIGEKGFGFKAVFSVAKEVHIQSGLWSFGFKHRKGQRGLGMVTPLDMSSAALPQDVTTRIKLRYSKQAIQQYSKLVQAVKDLPNTMIMFIQRIRTLHINVTLADGSCESSTITKTRRPLSSQCTITASQQEGGETRTETWTYLLFSSIKKSLPADERRKDRTEAKIELAFPIDAIKREPKLSETGQHVFAYLPLQRLPQIQFLIQSDFITSASRESVLDCAWNDALCEGVADLFVSAVTGTFAQPNHKLRYSWLDYLPIQPMDHIWKQLTSSITEKLKVKPVIQSREQRRFNVPCQFRHLVNGTLHNDEPLFPDLAEEIYLAKEYASRHRKHLSILGVTNLNWDDIVGLLQADVVRMSSRLKNTPPQDSWHETFSDLLLRLFLLPSQSRLQLQVKRLALLPLSGSSQWTGAPGVSSGGPQKIYFANVGTTPIPEHLPLSVLDRDASANSRRRAFSKAMGVEECTKATVFAKIKDRHCDLFGGPFGTFGSFKAPDLGHDHFFFLFCQRCSVDDIKTWVKVPLNTGETAKASDTNLYFPSDAEFDMFKLLPTQNTSAKYLAKSLFKAEPPTPSANNEDWSTWLARVTGARYFPPLTRIDNVRRFGMNRRQLSTEVQDVIKHKPVKFLGLLRAHWDVYQMEANQVEQELRSCQVLCRSGKMVPLHTTYLPTTEVITMVDELGIPARTMPMLSISLTTLDEITYRSWKFLEEFGVCSKPNMTFFVLAIQAMAGSDFESPDISKVTQIYANMAQMATVQHHDQLRMIFDDSKEPTIWDQHDESWTFSSECIIDGPDFIRSKSVLERSYPGNDLLRGFFTTVLHIPTWTIQDIVEEIESREQWDDGSTKIPEMCAIYDFLLVNATTDSDWQYIKTAFAEKKLVFGENGCWHTLRTCLWRSPFALSGFQDLSIIYPDLEQFFVRKLGVKKASPSMLINEVRLMAEESEPRIGEIRARLLEIGTMLNKSPIESRISRALDNLKEVKFLPKMQSEQPPILVGAADDFAISDHARYGETLMSHDVLLDFQIHETQIMHTMFTHLGLTHRYLSAMVEEVSAVGELTLVDERLSRELQLKAYGLYCCAAKYKSRKALQGESTLYTQLSKIVIQTSDEISTNLVLALDSAPLVVPSNRSFIHHDVVEDTINIYVPYDQRTRRSCYRSQLPLLLASILGVSQAAVFSISCIIGSNPRDLDDVLLEQDIPEVEWIQKPVIEIPDSILESERPSTPVILGGHRDVRLIQNPPLDVLTPDATPSRERHARLAISPPPFFPHVAPLELPGLVEQVVRVAQRRGSRYRNPGDTAALAQDDAGQLRHFNHATTFGSRETDSSHNRKIGAVGEGFIFTLLSSINIPNFNESNWPSTIRSELIGHYGFQDLTAWHGRETSDLVYTDTDGTFTKYLRQNCEGGFPTGIYQTRDLRTSPIEYYLEVKSTTGPCGTRFYMSGKQYDRMESMAVHVFGQNKKVYVILRVHDMLTPEVGLKIFVDPLRFKGNRLEFETEQWYVNTT
ncbi:hypothetical protein FB567DRAFT_581505 [Paraphoma chrysanthemicola]|uniref:Protein NO VEIN C-terminal domain-containing protein n=1 Tax=Paraphoma chrysanthemicola TaxID=798071 RepID=A0A8K0R0X4_9PLEO|nr:hypothetical protein FB567DRAFT_581505 [Paraphoma chrysanthemicola]